MAMLTDNTPKPLALGIVAALLHGHSSEGIAKVTVVSCEPSEFVLELIMRSEQPNYYCITLQVTEATWHEGEPPG